jgi:hypothetical protein
MAVAGALCAALAAAGCGLGPGEEAGEVQLRVTRGHGATVLVPEVTAEIRESDTVLRLLDRSAEIGTRYSGGFVQSVEGLDGGRDGGRLVDWFYSVNGVEPGLGAAEYELRDGDRVWWDHRDWTAAMRMPANVGSFPEPLLHGYEGERHPVVLECLGRSGCALAGRALEAAGVSYRRTAAPEAIRVLVGSWPRVRRDPAARLIESGPAVSGVFAEFLHVGPSWRLILLDERANLVRSAGRGAALVAAVRDREDPPVWVVTGIGPSGVRAAAGLLDEETLAGKFAVGPGGEALPVR